MPRHGTAKSRNLVKDAERLADRAFCRAVRSHVPSQAKPLLSEKHVDKPKRVAVIFSICKTKFQIMEPKYVNAQLWEDSMRSFFKASTAALGLVAAMATGAIADGHAKLSGDLVIFSDMSNPAPRATMEDMAAVSGRYR